MNRSVIVVGVTLIWQKVVAAMHIDSSKTILALFKFGGQVKNHQTAKLKSPPNKPRRRYVYVHGCICTNVHIRTCMYVCMSAHTYTDTCIPGMNQVYEYLYVPSTF